MEADFSGYATRSGIKCSDGLTIMPDAFKHQDKMTVPLVWQHQHGSTDNLLGHAVLENRPDGVYANCYLNNSKAANDIREGVRHGDVNSLSIFANGLRKQGDLVMHGQIREVSVVLAGANPGALIDFVAIRHGDGSFEELEDEAVIFSGTSIKHADDKEDTMADGRTIKDIIDTMTPEQKDVLFYSVGEALKQSSTDEDEEDSDEDASDEDASDEDDADEDENEDVQHDNTNDETLSHKEDSMTKNMFDQTENSATHTGATLTHDQITTIFKDAQKNGSLKDAVLAHADEYGITNIDMLFPDAKAIRQTPDFIKRRTEWVADILDGANHNPFSRIKSLSADITHDEARAKGYIKGNLKKEEFFGLQKRVTTPQTVYKKQKLDRDDILDASDFDVVVWLKAEMRLMLEEEIARAALIGDGRDISDEDKILDPGSLADGRGIRSIANDHEFYAHRVNITMATTPAAIEENIIRAMDEYKGTGEPALYTTRAHLTDLLLQKDQLGRRYYKTREELASALGVSKVVPVDVMTSRPDIYGIVVNIRDYSFGADSGGQTTFFDDFDIDYNQYKYLYEARLSGALTLPKSAIVIEVTDAPTPITPGQLVPIEQGGETIGVTIPPVSPSGAYQYETNNSGEWVLVSPGSYTAEDFGVVGGTSKSIGFRAVALGENVLAGTTSWNLLLTDAVAG